MNAGWKSPDGADIWASRAGEGLRRRRVLVLAASAWAAGPVLAQSPALPAGDMCSPGS